MYILKKSVMLGAVALTYLCVEKKLLMVDIGSDCLRAACLYIFPVLYTRNL